MISDFHLLRPAWLLALIPVALLGLALWRQSAHASGWERWVRPELLTHLLDGAPGQPRRWRLAGLLSGWILAVVALAGPTWQQLPQPAYRSTAPLVILLDLSPSMAATDLKPSRLTHARHRLIDLLRLRDEGLSALVVYAGDAHVVAPLSQDRKTLLALAPTLSPAIMPVAGSRVEKALEQAHTLLRNGGHGRGDILLITDGIAPEALPSLRQQLADSPYRLSLLGIGTAAGAPIPLPNGRFAQDAEGNLVLARLERAPLQALAQAGGGLYRDLALDGSDVEALEAFLAADSGPQTATLQAGHFDRWEEAGPWLVLLLLPLAALSHRRGWLVLVLLVPLSLPRPALALEWQALWLTPDQQGARALDRGDAETATRLFEDPAWQGQALYQQEAYREAAERFEAALERRPDADLHYNRGTALARAGELEAARDAFEQALALAPEMEDARYNRDLVEQLLQQRPPQPQSQASESGQDQSQNQNQSQSRQPPPEDGADSAPSKPPPPGAGTAPTESQDPGGQPPSPPREAGKGAESPEPSEGSAPPQGEASDTPQGAAEEATPEDPERDQGAPQTAPQERQASGTGTPVGEGGDTEPEDPVLERWLRQLPEDPGGLLRRKFAWEYRQRQEAAGNSNHSEDPDRW